ncbi:MAG: hypothetical protein M1376_24450 [Planctomycetes bacterium]|nr:hypothetical protein [Planctomycetota bacterium]
MNSPTTITGPTLLITVALAVMTFIVPRRYLLLPYVIGACFAPADQTVMVGELNFQVLRILVVVGMLRLALRGEIIALRWNRFDKLVLAWFVVGSIVYVTQWMSFGAFINRCGRFVEWLCLYWVFRQSVRSWQDLRFAYVALAFCALIMLPFVVLEWIRGTNPFAVLGRVVTTLREENYRCQATFPHAIMMGLFWATLVPLFVGFARQQARYRWVLWSAVGASALMIWMTASSTPILTLVAVAVLLLAFPLRQYTGTAAWGVLALLFALSFVMKAPVWHLIARVGVVSGSTGWHRFYLIDEAIRHFSQWMLLGTHDTGSWGLGLEDVTNQYILEGVRGGFLTLVLFGVILFVGARTMVRLSLRSRDRSESYLAWGLFVTIIAHCLSFLGVSYFGQIDMIWYLLLAGVALCYGQVHEAAQPVPGRLAVAARPQHAY